MSSLIATKASDTVVDFNAPISAVTESRESHVTSSIPTIKISDVGQLTTTNQSNCDDVGDKDFLSPSSSPCLITNNPGCDDTDKTVPTRKVYCQNQDGSSNLMSEDSLDTTATSISNGGMESISNDTIAHESKEMLVSSQIEPVYVNICETIDATTLTTVPDVHVIDDCNDHNDDVDDDDDDDDGRIRLGICAMDKKARSKPMAEILSRIDENTYRVVFFGDTVLLEDSPTTWPLCDALIAFYSKGYPLQKVKEYVKICKPYVLNDLDMQEVIQDRRRVYDTLLGSGIDVPRHVYLSRDGYKSTGSGDGNGSNDQSVIEHDDSIVVNGITIQKPFVEKPVNAENHNISIYYPTAAGGGCKKLFRKIGNRSSEFYPDINEVRQDGSYIYEEFVETQGTDVKMYTVGPGMYVAMNIINGSAKI